MTAPAIAATATIVVIGEIEIAPSDLEALLDTIRPHLLRVRRKQGCLHYHFAVDVADGGVIRMSEMWRDQESLNRHLADEEFKNTLRALAPVLIRRREVTRFAVANATPI